MFSCFLHACLKWLNCLVGAGQLRIPLSRQYEKYLLHDGLLSKGAWFSYAINKHDVMKAIKFEQEIDSYPQMRAAERNNYKCIRADLVLGSPVAGCSGLGVCRILSARQTWKGKCPKVSAWMSVADQGQLRVSFMKNSMDLKMMRRHFRWTLFQVLEAFELPAFLVLELQLEQLWIAPGIYTVWETPDLLIVDF